MKRMNRKKIIITLEELRGLCASIMTDAKEAGVEWKVMCYRAYYDSADRMIVELGGESNKDTMDEIERRWKELDNNKLNK